MEERLQKIIARAGVASRRAAEEIILAGRVRVNGRVVTELGQKADRQKDRIEVDGKRLVSEVPVYVVLHKPRNVVSTLRDPEGRPTVADYVRGAGARLYPVGRLDFATSGVLLMTNDGDFANALLHPRGGVPKTYVLKVQGEMSDADLNPWREGVRLEDGVTLPAEARLLRREGTKSWIEVTLREGRNQQIRRMGEATGWPVMRLARTSFAGVSSEGLRPGEWRALNVQELLEIRDQFGVPKRIRGALMGASSGRVDQRRTVAAARAAEKPAPHRAPEAAGPTARGPQRARSGRSDRSETKPQAAETRAPQARAPGRR
jgi:23S rRNA pseudouridine2605 synthase